MKPIALLGAIWIAACLCSCTTSALHHNAVNQSKTVSDILADEVLYNLALFKDFYDGKTFNCIPSFVTLATGTSQIQDSVTPQISMAYPAHNGGTGAPTYTPQIAGTHQTQDAWSFTPVVDPAVLDRLFWLYSSEFTNVPEEKFRKIIFPPQPDLDQWGRPNLDYIAKPDPAHAGFVLMTNNQPVFETRLKAPSAQKGKDDVPGAIYGDGKRKSSWFEIDPPCKLEGAIRAGSFRGKTIWITDRTNFFNFAFLALGGTNGSSTLRAAPYFLNLNGLILSPPRQ